MTPQRELERRLSVLEDILDVSPNSPCAAHDDICDGPCGTEKCARSNNRLTDLGSLVTTLIHEFRWYRAWAEELESVQMVPPGTVGRVGLRVQRAMLEETLREAEESRDQVKDLPGLVTPLLERIQELRTQIAEIDKTLKGAEA